MNDKALFNFSLYFTGIVTLFVWTMLVWAYYHGGVPSHHILNNKNLPAISNWWSGLLLPLITWVLLYRIQTRIKKQNAAINYTDNSLRPIILGFFGGLMVGLLLAISFNWGYSIVLDNILYVLLLLAFLFPIYKSEYILGFIIGMTYTFGAILPTAFAVIVAGISVIIYKYIRPLILRLVQMLRR